MELSFGQFNTWEIGVILTIFHLRLSSSSRIYTSPLLKLNRFLEKLYLWIIQWMILLFFIILVLVVVLLRLDPTDWCIGVLFHRDGLRLIRMVLHWAWFLIGFFRNSHGMVVFCSHDKLGVGFSFEAGFSTAVTTLEHTHMRGFTFISLEYDSTYVVVVFASFSFMCRGVHVLDGV